MTYARDRYGAPLKFLENASADVPPDGPPLEAIRRLVEETNPKPRVKTAAERLAEAAPLAAADPGSDAGYDPDHDPSRDLDGAAPRRRNQLPALIEDAAPRRRWTLPALTRRADRKAARDNTRKTARENARNAPRDAAPGVLRRGLAAALAPLAARIAGWRPSWWVSGGLLALAVMIAWPLLLPGLALGLAALAAVLWLTLGAERSARWIGAGFARYERRRPAQAARLLAGLQRLSRRAEAALARLPESWTRGLYLPDFDPGIAGGPDKLARDKLARDPFDRLAEELARQNR